MQKLTVTSPNQAGVYSACVIIVLASILAVGLRVYSRKTKNAPLKSDDYLAISSMSFVWAIAIVLIVGATQGSLGTHTMFNPVTGALIPTWHEVDVSKLAGISQLLIIPALGLIKSSVVMLYRRIFVGKTFRTISLIVLIIIIVWTVSFFFATVFECGRNLGLLWQSEKTFKGNCGKYKFIQIGHTASDVATDLIVLALPLPVIWGLHITGPRKLALSFIFLLGFLSTAAGLARLAIVAKDIYETTTGARDVRGVETNAMIWSFIEVGVAVVAACLPTLRPVFNSRTAESLVNSVRSAISLQSFGSGNRRRDLEAGAGDSRSQLPLKNHEMITPNRLNQNANSTTNE